MEQAMTLEEMEREMTVLREAIRRVELAMERLERYELNGLQSAKFKNLSELFAANEHTH